MFLEFAENSPYMVHILMKRYILSSTIEYDEWERALPKKDQQQIAKRFALIQEEGHFGTHHSVSTDNSVWELTWRNGRRIYYSIVRELNVLVILGGSKNGQEKDIERARNILARRKTS